MQSLEQTSRVTDYGVTWDHHGRAQVRYDGLPIDIHLTDSPDDDHQVQVQIDVRACNGAVVIASRTSTFAPHDVVSYGPTRWLFDEVQETARLAEARLRELHTLHLQRATTV